MQTRLLDLQAISQINLQRTNRAFPAHAGSDADGRTQVLRFVGHSAGVDEYRLLEFAGSAFEGDGALPLDAANRQVAARPNDTIGQRNADVPVAIAAHRVVATGAKQLRDRNARSVFGQHRASFCTHGNAAGFQRQNAKPAPHGAGKRLMILTQRGAGGQFKSKGVTFARERQAVKIAAGPDVIGRQRRAVAGVNC